MDKKVFLPFELAEPERRRALASCLEQLREWSLTMPDEEPVLRHFGLDEFYDIGEIEFWIANRHEHGYCSKFLFLFDGQTCPTHHHEVKHETFFVMKGEVSMTVDGRTTRMLQGDTLSMPVRSTHCFTGVGPALVLEVSKPSIRGDSYFADQRIQAL